MFYGELTDSKYYKYKKNNILSVAVSKKAIHIEHTDVLACTFVTALFFVIKVKIRIILNGYQNKKIFRKIFIFAMQYDRI